jgi:hypothetical protein
MKNLNLLPLLFLVIFSSCNNMSVNPDIEKVRKSKVTLGLWTTVVVDDLVKDIAGSEGKSRWKSFKPDTGKENQDILFAQVNITRNKEKNNHVSILFLLNRETGLVKTGAIKVDGRIVSVMEFYKILSEIGINNII